MEDPHSQYRYQVRFEWGAVGAATVGIGVDVIVWVDVLDTEATFVPDAADSHVQAIATDPLRDILPQAAVVAGGFRNRTAVAQWVLDQQAVKGDRFTVAVIAAGGVRADGTSRFTVEDMLAAGAVVDALAGVGIDYCSPEAAAACAAFTTLTRASAHLVSASGSGQQLIDLGRRSDVDDACEVDVSQSVPVLRGTEQS
ncbi:MAG: 2-phosphosulfolactate phosphatase [Terrimesophilobacter sp.]